MADDKQEQANAAARVDASGILLAIYELIAPHVEQLKIQAKEGRDVKEVLMLPMSLSPEEFEAVAEALRKIRKLPGGQREPEK